MVIPQELMPFRERVDFVVENYRPSRPVIQVALGLRNIITKRKLLKAVIEPEVTHSHSGHLVPERNPSVLGFVVKLIL